MENIITNQSWYLITKDVLTIFFTVAGLIIAGMGLWTWKKQIKGTKNFETAYNVYYSVLKLRDAIKSVRNPAIWLPEMDKALQYSKDKYKNKTLEEIEKNVHPYVYEMRWEEIIRALTEMESHLLSAEVLWGPDLLKLVRPLNAKVSELNISLKQNFQSEIRTKNFDKIHEAIYDIGDQDKFSASINQAIKEIEVFLKPHLN